MLIRKWSTSGRHRYEMKTVNLHFCGLQGYDVRTNLPCNSIPASTSHRPTHRPTPRSYRTPTRHMVTTSSVSVACCRDCLWIYGAEHQRRVPSALLPVPARRGEGPALALIRGVYCVSARTFKGSRKGDRRQDRPEKIRIVSMPVRRLLSEPSGGFGVTEREGIGVTERETTPFSLLSFDSGSQRGATQSVLRLLGKKVVPWEQGVE